MYEAELKRKEKKWEEELSRREDQIKKILEHQEEKFKKGNGGKRSRSTEKIAA